MKAGQGTTERRERGDEYEFHCTIEAEWYNNWYINELLSAIKEKMPLLRSKRCLVQQDGATPNPGQDNPEILYSSGMERG